MPQNKVQDKKENAACASGIFNILFIPIYPCRR
jgi:hypothetical protein